MADESNVLLEIALENTVNGEHFGELINNEMDKLDTSAVSVQINELTLIDVGSLDEEENMWLSPSGSPLPSGIEKEWLKGELDLTGVTVEKNILVDMLDDLSRKSHSNFHNSPKSPTNSETSERSIRSPPILPSAYLCPQAVSSTPLGSKQKTMSPKTSQGGRIIAEDAELNPTTNREDGDHRLNSTFDAKENMNSTLNKVSSPSTGLNSTFNKDSPGTGLNSTFSKNDLTNLNSTYSKEGNATFDTAENMNATFETNNVKNNFDMKATGEEEEMSIASSTNEEEGSTNSSMDDGIVKPSDSAKNLENIVQDRSHDSQASPRGLDTKPVQSETHISKLRPPPPTRLQVLPSFRYKTPVPTSRPAPTPATSRPTTTPAIGVGFIRSGLRPPTLVPRKTLKSPKTGLRPPTVAPGKGLRLPSSVQVRQVRPLTSARGNSLRPATSIPDRGLRPCSSVGVSGLKKPSGIVRPPGVVARPSGLARPAGRGVSSGLARPNGSGIALPANARKGKPVNGSRDVPGRTG